MRMIFFYTVVFFQALISCNSSGTKKTFKNDEIVSPDTIDKTKQEHSFLKKRVLGSNPFKRDTTINNYYVSYIIHDNDDVIMTLPITDGKGLDTVYYNLMIDFVRSRSPAVYNETDYPDITSKRTTDNTSIFNCN